MNKGTMAVLSLSAVVGGPCFAGSASGAGASAVQIQSFLDPAGVFQTLDSMGGFDPRSPFFQSLGTNGRSCGTCHLPNQAFTLSAAAAGLTFALTQGRDPLFAPVDGANCPNARPRGCVRAQPVAEERTLPDQHPSARQRAIHDHCRS